MILDELVWQSLDEFNMRNQRAATYNDVFFAVLQRCGNKYSCESISKSIRDLSAQGRVFRYNKLSKGKKATWIAKRVE